MTELTLSEKVRLRALSRKVREKAAAKTQRPLGEALARQGGLAAKHTATGLTMLPGMIGDAANALINLPIQGLNAVTGASIPTLGRASDTIASMIAATFPKEETTTEKIVGGASELLASVPTGVPLVKLGKAFAPLAQQYGAQALTAMAGGATGAAAEEAFPKTPYARALGTLTGAGLAGAGQALAASRAAAKAVPSKAAIKSMSDALYKEADESGVIIRKEAIQTLAKQVKDKLAELGIDQKLNPGALAAYQRLEAAGGENITLKGVDILRRVAKSATQSPNASERMMAGRIIEKIDDFVENIKPADVLTGDATAAASALTRARPLWGTMRKAEMIDDAVEVAVLQAKSTNSGGNVQNVIRQKLRMILTNPRKARAFTPQERRLMKAIVSGTPAQNIMRLVGRLDPRSNSALASLWPLLGYGAFGPAGLATAAVPLAGLAAKTGATALTRRAVDNLSRAIRSGATPGAASSLASAQKAALDRQLLQQGLWQYHALAGGFPSVPPLRGRGE